MLAEAEEHARQVKQRQKRQRDGAIPSSLETDGQGSTGATPSISDVSEQPHPDSGADVRDSLCTIDCTCPRANRIFRGVPQIRAGAPSIFSDPPPPQPPGPPPILSSIMNEQHSSSPPLAAPCLPFSVPTLPAPIPNYMSIAPATMDALRLEQFQSLLMVRKPVMSLTAAAFV